MRGLIFVCVLFSEFIVRLPTNTHLGTLIQISHHTHTPPCRYTSTPALSLFGMPPFTANLPPDWLCRYHHHQPITSQLAPPPPLSQPFTTSSEIIYFGSSLLIGRRFWGFDRIYGFSGCSVSHLLPSSRPSPSYGLLEKNQHKFSLFEGWGQQLDSQTDGI